MSKVFLVSGFLGSGKTTLIKSLVEYFSVANIKSALIVNEIGEIGIDNTYMKRLGYNIWELYGGCICCTLASGLVDTIEELKKYNPDVILIEPSGAAEPKITIDALLNMGFERSDIVDFFLLDTTRLEMFLAVLQPLMLSSIEAADVVLVNKFELAGQDLYDEAIKIISEVKPEIACFKVARDNLVNEDIKGFIKEHLSSKGA